MEIHDFYAKVPKIIIFCIDNWISQKNMEHHHFSAPVSVFHGIPLPEEKMTLAGYAALISSYQLRVPLPWRLAAISSKHRKYETAQWRVFTPKHNPADTFIGHLTFALKYEEVDLAVLSALFATVNPEDITAIIQNEPTGQYSRRIWFFYEWLTDRILNIPNAAAGDYVDALNADMQYPGPVSMSKRHRVRNNLPGVQSFCPLIRRTEKLDRLMDMDLPAQARNELGKVHPDIVARAAAFLLLKDSKASYAIEGERPPHNRAERWGRAIGQAGREELTLEELLRLQTIVIEDARFIHMGWRNQGGFVGVHDRATGAPIPDHISARWQDVPRLMEGLIAMDKKLATSSYNPVLSAALIAFGFVFIHPFEDGNGRIHRYLIHHVLAEKDFAPKGIVFPVSAVILDRIEEYRITLENYSKAHLPLIEWEPTDRGNVSVLNETFDLYRFFDATLQAEFLYECVQDTVEKSLPEEVEYLARHDRMKAWIGSRFDMPDRTIELLISFLRQGDGKFSKRALDKEFSQLTPSEAEQLEKAFADIFADRNAPS